MITSRRLRERQAREAGIKPPPPAPHPHAITWDRHQRALDQFKDAHKAEVRALNARIAALNAALEAAQSEVLEYDAPVIEADEPERDELISRLVESHTKSDLEAMCDELGLSLSGTKAELAAAIVDHQGDG